MRHFVALVSLLTLFATAPAFAQQEPSCDSFPSGIERIAKAENMGQIDDVMVEFGSQNRLGEESLQSIFGGDLNVAKETASEILKGIESQNCPSQEL